MNVEQVLKLIDAVSASEITGLDYEEDGTKLHLVKKQGKVQVVTEAHQPSSHIPQAAVQTAALPEQDAQEKGQLVKSPLVGVFYTAPAEGAKPFVSVGDSVKKGQTLAIVEAMKLMNEIESDYDGTVLEILAENDKPVEYGQPLFRIG